jgi:hypothetical protein
LIVILVAIAVCLLLLGIWSALHPYDALILLLGLLVFHSGAVHVLQNVFQMDSRLLLLLSSWKEVVIAGVVVAALVRFRRRPFRPDFIALVVIAFLGLIGIRVALDMVARVGLSDELLGARNASEFAILFLAVTILAPDVAWLRRASWVLVPLVLLAAEVGIVQLLFGFRFYNVLYHAPGEVLTSAFSAKFGGLIVPRAVGTYTAPNEFGLGLVIYLVAILLPLAFTRLNSATRTLLAVAATLACLALALTYSRSAWLGVALAVPVVALLLRRPIARWVDAHRRRGMAHMRMMTMCLAAIVVLVGGVFVVSGGFRFLVTTLTGIEALLSHPLGGGLTSAGPKAKSLNPTAVLTENWYLVYGIQLGWLALAALCTFAAACLVSLARRVNATLTSIDAVTERVAFQVGAIGALLAALGGALFIPALLDLPASLTVWTFVAVALVPATVEPVDAPTRLDTAEAQPPAAPAT